MTLDGQVVIVTGGAGLIGKAFISAIVKAGGIGIIADLDSKNGRAFQEQLCDEVGSESVVFFETDITSLHSIRDLISRIENQYGHIDALVNNAYPRNAQYGNKFESVTYESFCENVNMHLGGYFLVTQQVAQFMKKQNSGNIINMASIYGFRAPRFDIYEGTEMTMPVEYAAIKGAVINLTYYLAAYLGPYNIRVNCISPGGVFDQQPSTFVNRYTHHVLSPHRMAESEDLTGVLLFLLSNAAQYMTGQNIVVDGGWTA